MYFTKDMFQKYAHYQEMDSREFIHKMCAKAVNRYQKGVKLKKSEAPVIYGTTVKDFNPDEDNIIARVEMNDRGVLRDFIGIDWDFDEGDEDKLQNVLDNLLIFSKEHQTHVYIYPTDSYPRKPRVRTIIFTKNLMNGVEYAKAVTYIEKIVKESHNDEGNYNINHNFNLPVINNQAQYDKLTVYIADGFGPLDNQLWQDIKPNKKGYAQNMNVKEIPVSFDEKMPHTQKDVDDGLSQLSESMKKGTNKKLDFDIWSNFFQFLHAIARAEVVGSITHDQALYILKTVAGGNTKWEFKNIEDYKRELPRVKSNEVKLKRARLLSYYFGMRW